MDSTHRISVALCTYNGAKYLDAQLESLLRQRMPAWEVVVSDDGSTDATPEIIARYRNRFPRMHILDNGCRLGPTRNFFLVFRACGGTFIAPCDQDDEWHEDKLASLVGTIGSADLAYCDSELIDVDGSDLGRKVSDYYRMYAGDDPRVFTLTNCVSGHASLFRRSLIDAIPPPPQQSIYYDWWLAIAAAARGGIRYVDRPLTRFRQHTDSVSHFTGGAGKDRVAQWRQETCNLESLSLVVSDPGTDEFFRAIAALWRRRRGRRFSSDLFSFALRNRHILFALRRTPPALRWRHALKFLSVPSELREYRE